MWLAPRAKEAHNFFATVSLAMAGHEAKQQSNQTAPVRFPQTFFSASHVPWCLQTTN